MTASEQKDNKIARVYEKYAPKNISLKQFKEMVSQDPDLLKKIGGKFSTWNIKLRYELKRNMLNMISKEELVDALRKFMDDEVIEQIAENYAKIYEKIICSDMAILRDALLFDTLNEEQRQYLAYKIIHELNRHFNINDKLNIIYQDRYKGQEKNSQDKVGLIQKFLNMFKRKKGNRENIEYDTAGEFLPDEKKIIIYKKYDFEEFVSTLSHEYGHFIDDFHPNLGMLGAQLADYGDTAYITYEENHDKYFINPTEASSFKIEHAVKKQVSDVLAEQVKTKIGSFKADLAALELQKQKAWAKLAKAEYAILQERGLGNLSFKKRSAFFEKLTQENPKVKKLSNQYHKLSSRYYALERLITQTEQQIKKDKMLSGARCYAMNNVKNGR